MILVDSSVWIDYFRGDATPQTERLDALLGAEPLLTGDMALPQKKFVEFLQDMIHPIRHPAASDLIKEGTDINPHYRKITPMVADELAKWGDWKNAVWIWESVLGSRPYVVAIMTNTARGYAQMGQNEKALEVLAKAKALQPKATSVNSLEVILLSRTGKEPEALKKAKALVEEGRFDLDLINAAYVLATRAKDWPLAIKSLELRAKNWPNTAVDGALKSGNIYASVAEVKDETKALTEYRKALTLSSDAEKTATRAQIPTIYQPRL